MIYVYFWLREDGTPYYIGKGRGKRGYINSKHVVPRPTSREYILTQEYKTDEEAFEAEKFFISHYGRKDIDTGILRNMSDGGEGVINPSLKHREIKRQALLGKRIGAGRVVSDKTRKALSSALKGKPKSLEHRRKLSILAKSRKCSESTREKMRLAHSGKNNGFFGRKHSEETKEKIGEAQRKRLACRLS